MEYFIFCNDTTGKELKEALMQKAAEGVTVRFLYDDLGNISVPRKFYNEMKEVGVDVRSFMKMRFSSLAGLIIEIIEN